MTYKEKKLIIQNSKMKKIGYHCGMIPKRVVHTMNFIYYEVEVHAVCVCEVESRREKQENEELYASLSKRRTASSRT